MQSGRLPSYIQNAAEKEIEAAVPPVRGPDYATINVSALTTGQSFTLDACGNAYNSFQFLQRFPISSDAKSTLGAIRFGANVSLGWLNQTSTPREGKLNSFLTGPAISFSVGTTKIFGGGVTYSPGNGTASELGAYTPGAGIADSGSWQFGRTNFFSWRGCN